MTAGILDRLAACRNLSRAESAVAQWVERNLRDIPLQTAGDIARGAGVSEMTITRFVRHLGYDNYKAFKTALNEELRHAAGETSRLRQLRVAVPDATSDALQERLKLEVEAIIDVYSLAGTPQWEAALDVVCDARRVNITGFQGSKGLAMDFATRLKYARKGVRFAEGISGNWSELFAEDPEHCCVILVDTVPYATAGLRISELCLRRSIPLVLITDRYSAWPRKYTPHALSVSTFTRSFLDSTAGLSALLGLFLNAITARIGKPAEARIAEMRDLALHFQNFSLDPDTQTRPLPRREDDVP
jgi:DNA-binding MurR/RpiR family transcriptional regulator